MLWDFGSAAKHHQLYAPWLPGVELAGRRHLDARRDAARDRRARRAGRDASTRELRERGLAGEPLGIDLTDMETLYSLHAPGHRDGRRAAA